MTMNAIVRRSAAMGVLTFVGFALGVAAVPSPTIQHRQAEADVVRCTEALELTLHFTESAIHQLRDHIGRLPTDSYRSAIAQDGGR